MASVTASVTQEQLMQQIKGLERKVNRLQRHQTASDKAQGIEPVKSKNNGFNKAEAMSPVLCNFLGLQTGSELPRPEVTKRISVYVKANNLQDGKRIKLDTSLVTLLGVPIETEVTYFTLQKYLKDHFLKKTVSDPSTSTAPVAAAVAAVAAPAVSTGAAGKTPKAPKRRTPKAS